MIAINFSSTNEKTASYYFALNKGLIIFPLQPHLNNTILHPLNTAKIMKKFMTLFFQIKKSAAIHY